MSIKKKKIAIFVNSLARGGAEKVVFLLTKELRKDFEIHLLVFYADIIAFELPADVKVVQVGKPGTAAKASGLLRIFQYARLVKKYLQANQIPVILSFLNRPNFTVGMVKMIGWKGAAVICERTMTSTYYNGKTFSGKVGRFLVKHLYKHADLIITNSRLNEADMQTTFGLTARFITIYNPVDVAEAKLARETSGAVAFEPGGDFVFCNIGRYDYYKNQGLLLRALAQTPKNIKLKIIGKDVPEKLAPLCKELGLEDRVELTGLQHNILPYLLSSHAFVLSSVMEGFPNVVLEALSCSLPVVSTDCKSGPREILAPGTLYPEAILAPEEAEFGLLVKNDDASMLAAAMQQLASSPQLYNHYAGKALARAQCFDLPLMLLQFSNVINSFYHPAGSGEG